MLGTRTLALFALIVLIPSALRATTFVMMDEPTLLASSDVVLVGTVTAIESTVVDENAPLYTYVHIQPTHVIKGAVGTAPIVLREPGGTAGPRTEWVFGAPEFWVGERDLLFLSRNTDGTLQTNSLSMGKFTLSVDAAGHTTAVRNFGYGSSVLLPATGQLLEAQPETQSLAPLITRMHRRVRRAAATAPLASLHRIPPELDGTPTEFHEAYTFLGNPPARWFEPDCSLPVNYFVSSVGDATLDAPPPVGTGPGSSQAAVDAALAAWTNVPTANLILADGGPTDPGPFGQCSISRLVFNDPNNEITDPSGCGGVLAIGGYCTGIVPVCAAAGNPEAGVKAVNGTAFAQIVVGKVTFNNGWGGCAVWNQCNVEEVATHEIGHTIGLGHSTTTTCVGGDNAGAPCATNGQCASNKCAVDATMAASAHFDGRCAGVRSDDIAALSFAYPQIGTPLPTPTPTDSRTPTLTGTATDTPTITPTPTLTRTPVATLTVTSSTTPSPSRTSAATATATRTRTLTPTGTPTSTRTASRTPTSTASATFSSTPTATRTPTPSRTPSNTASPSLTPTATATASHTASASATITPSPTATQPLFVQGRIGYYSTGLGVDGASVVLSGTASATIRTDSTGTYQFTDVLAGAWQVAPQKSGDIGTAVSALDAVYALQSAAGARILNPEQRLACDVTGNGSVSALDASLILQYDVDLIPRLPVALTCNSDWAFVPIPAPVSTQQVLQPEVVSGTCHSGAITYQALSGTAASQDFAAVLFGDCTGNWQPPSSAPLSPPSTATVRLGRTRVVGPQHRLRVPVAVRTSGTFRALDVDLEYDAAQFTLHGVRLVGAARNALLAANRTTAGVVKLALASNEPLRAGAVIMLELDVQARPTQPIVHITRAVVGDI